VAQEFVQGEQFRVFVKVPFDIAERSGDVRQKFRIAFHPVDVHEPAGRFEITLNAREIK
jgi:hypothetical protein